MPKQELSLNHEPEKMEIRPYEHRTQYYETDQMGIIHQTHYMKWMEEARMNLMNQIGLGYKQMEALEIISPVLSVSIDYRSMVHFDEAVVIETRILKYDGIKMELEYIMSDKATGDTLCDEKHPIILESMEFPEPVIRVAIEPKTKAGQEKMGIALAKLAEEDPTFKAYTDEETGQTIIAGMGELHLEIIVDRLMREFKVEANVGKPQVAYKETIRKNADSDMKYARQSGGKGQYGHVKIRIEPNPGKGYEFVNAVVGGTVPKEYIPAVDQGIQGAMLSGVLAGYNVVDVKVTLYDGSYHEVDSSEMAFKIAGSMAFKDAMRKADPVIMEPIMKVVVTVPEEYLGNVIGDLNSRRGIMQNQEATPGAMQITSEVPLSEMFGYATDMRSKTQGRGQYTMEPSHYAEVPKSVSETIIASRKKAE